ncbi:MAG: hypothetical protein KQH79_13415 [Bacteroidetes bacterium]|nr:hypothetical protein [Bacteroidota bacterium]
MITYFLMGIIASTILGYKEMFSTPPMSYLMKPIDSTWVAAGPILQVLRGLVFAIALWIIKDSFLFKNRGWLKLWILVVSLSILSTAGPTPGSIEGIIYTKIPVLDQLKGYLEILPQTFLFSVGIYFWYRNPKRTWNILSAVLVVIISMLSLLGMLALI